MRQELNDVPDQLIHTSIKHTHQQTHRLFYRKSLETMALRKGTAVYQISPLLEIA